MGEYLESITMEIVQEMRLRKVTGKLNAGEPETRYFVELRPVPEAGLDRITKGVNVKLPEDLEIEIEVPERAYELLLERKTQIKETILDLGTYATLTIKLGIVMKR